MGGNVQVRSAKLVDGMKNLEYPERLKKLDLLHRRERGDMIQVWKHFAMYDQSTLSTNFRPIPRTNRNHKFQLTWNRAKDGTRGTQNNSSIPRFIVRVIASLITIYFY